MKVLVVITPIAGGGKAARGGERLVQLLGDRGHAVERCSTRNPEESGERVRKREAAGDLDRDGLIDLVSAAAFSYTGNELAWWHNDGTPFAGEWVSTWHIESPMSDLLLADLDQDGALETVILRQGSTELVAWRELLERMYLPVVMRGWEAK